MAYDLFLSIPNIPGESVNKGFPNQIEVYSYSLGFSNTATFTNPGGTEGKVSVSDISILKKFDKSSLPLLKASAQGANVAPASNNFSMVLSLVPTSGTAATITYTFQDVYVTGISDSGSTGGDDAPTQSVSFAFGIIRETYRVQNPDGSLGSPVTVSYNKEVNRVA